jgi:hypothetical protein
MTLTTMPRPATRCPMSHRGGPGRSTVQFEREASRADSSASAKFWQGGSPEPIIAKVSQETLAEMIGTTRFPGEFFHEQISKTGLNRFQRQYRNPQFIVECRSARPAAD